jgi:hypothetical protein
MVVVTLIGLGIWRIRAHIRALRWAAVAMIVALQLAMNDPVYYLIARIDITGGSKGWHRAALIESSINHIDEWWAAGTDHTRHWMPTGIPANENHTDITNHFLAMGVMGGVPLLVMFAFVLREGFRAVGKAIERHATRARQQRYLCWTLGTMLFAHVMNFWSISLFDQSVSFFYLVIACIGACHTARAVSAVSVPLVNGRRGHVSLDSARMTMASQL